MSGARITSVFLIWAGFILLLGVVPWHLPTNPDLPNSAAMLGYNVSAAYLLLAGWTVICFVVLARFSRPSVPAQTQDDPAPEPGPGLWLRWAERAVVAAAVLIVYWPAAIARFGKHVEDAYFLTALQRMSCGDLPYVDFEFLYGPLMIIPAHLWMNAFGFSMTSYYAYYALLQVALFVLILVLLQRFIPGARRRWFAFFLLLPFYADILYGLNWIGWRHIAGILAIIVISGSDRHYMRAISTGAILGLSFAFSYEYAIAAWCAAAAILGARMLSSARAALPGLIGALLLMSGAMLAVGLGALIWATGAFFADYVEATKHAGATALSLGLGQFAFLWTGHSLALFLILSATLTAGAGAIRQIWQTPPNRADLMLVGAVIFALAALKIALQRADYLHLAVPFLPLVFVFLLGHPTRVFTFGRPVRIAVFAALIVASITHAIGHAPLGRWVALGMVRGLYHEVTDRDVAGPVEARRYSIQAERSEHQPHVTELARHLAMPELRDRPVLYYYQEWDMTLDAGTCAAGYSFYDLLYSDARRPLAQTALTPGLIVVINKTDYQKLFQGSVPASQPRKAAALARVARWTSSNHADQSTLEQEAEWAMWKNALGDRLVNTFHVLAELDGFVLLERNKE